MNRYRVMISLLLGLSLLVIPHISLASEVEVLNLQKAKELALKNSHALKNIILTVDKAKAGLKIANDTYSGTSAYEIWRSQLAYLRYLDQERTRLQNEGAAQEQIDALTAEIAEQEASIAVTKTLMNPTIDNALVETWRESQDTYDDALKNKDNFEKQLGYSVEQLYTTILNLQEQEKLLEFTLDTKYNLLSVEQLKEIYGLNSANDLEKASVEYATTAKMLANLKDQIYIYTWKFNDVLGRDLSVPLKLEGIEVEISKDGYTYDDVLGKSLKFYAGIGQQDRDLKQREDDLNDSDIKNNEDKKSIVNADIELKKISLSDTKTNIKTTVKDLVTKYQEKLKAYEIAIKTNSISEKSYKWDQLRYEIGLISKIQKDLSYISYLDSINKKNTAAYSYLLARRLVELAEQGIFPNGIGGTSSLNNDMDT